MRREGVILSFLTATCFLSCASTKMVGIQPFIGNDHFEFVKSEIRNPTGKYILVAAHRGDWRNAPENSLQSLKNAIEMGVDIVEFDIRKTRDGQYIVLHDDSLSRNTTGKGNVSDYTLEEIRTFKLRDGLGQPTAYSIPTFEEFMTVAKGKIVVDIDKGFNYLDDVVKIVEKSGMVNQSIINVSGTADYKTLQKTGALFSDSLLLMPVINMDKDGASRIVKSYEKRKPLIFQFTFRSDTSSILNQASRLRSEKYGIWMNSLWPQLSAGHNDDKAVLENQQDEAWGWLISRGTTVIQTDRPQALLQYLQSKRLRPDP